MEPAETDEVQRPWVLQFCHGYDGPFLDCARQYAALFIGTPYKVCTVYLTGRPNADVETGSISDEVVFLDYSSREVRGLKLKAIRDFKCIVKSRDFRFCIAHRFKPIYIALLGSKLPIIGVQHAFGVYERRSRQLFADTFKARLTLLGVSNAVRNDIRARLHGWPAERIETLYNRIDVETVQAQQLSRKAARDLLGLPRDAWVVGNVGRLHPDKDQATLIRGFALAQPKLPTGSLLAIMGSGQLKAPLKALATESGIIEQVRFLGQVPNGRRYFKAFDVFALTSDCEPFGMVLLEAMAAGVPVICTNCGGGHEVVQETGCLFPLGDAAALAAALVQQTISKPGELALLRQRMHDDLQLRFSDQAVTRQFWSLPGLSSFANKTATRTVDSNPWRAKAKALDHYRWQLLRERHGLPGSTLRFARDAIVDWWFGLQAHRRLARSIDTGSCDFLLLQSAPKIIGLRRKKLLIDALGQQAYRLIETALPQSRDICADFLLASPPYPTPLRYFGYAAHAAWIVKRYQPAVLLNDRNGSLYSPFLHLSLNSQSSLLVHLAHATTVESSPRLSMNDYDYYFLFGHSSLEALHARPLRFGKSNVVLTGSHMIDQCFDLPPANPCARTMLILGVGPDKEKEPGYQQTYRLLREWASANCQYRVLVKRHPRSVAPFWQETAQMLANVNVLPTDCSLVGALEQASLVVNIMSNAVIEAGLAARPVIYCNLSDDRDIFAQERFFGPAVTNPIELKARVITMENDFASCVEKARTFAKFHLAHGSHGLEKTVQVLQCLLDGIALPEDVEQCVLPGAP
jgi:glycosyltransferase involved in cell wall biosynthesis